MIFPIRRIRELHYNLLRRFVPDNAAMPAQVAISLTNLVNVALLAGLLAPVFVLVSLALQKWSMALSLTAAGLVMAGAPMLYRASGSLLLAREAFILAMFSLSCWLSLLFGGIVSPGSIWLVVCPALAVLLGSMRSALIWLVAIVATLVGMQLSLGNNVIFFKMRGFPHLAYLLSLIGLSVSLTLFIGLVDGARRKLFGRLEAANQIISDMALRDALTGVYNRRHIVNAIGHAERDALETAVGFCICLLDLDRFKAINDNHGHATGDEVLKAVAAAIQGEIREDDCFGRYGGEEFLLLLNNTDTPGALRFLERIRRRIEALRIGPATSLERQALEITVSIGVASYRGQEPSSQTIARADQAMYAAKAAGRNCVMLEQA